MRGTFNIRKITVGKPRGDTYGITIPRAMAKQHLETTYTIVESGPHILLQSGAGM